MEVSESDKKSDKKVKYDKPLFTKRLLAYFIDYLIVSFVAAFIAIAFIDGNKMNESNERIKNITDKIYASSEIDTLKYEELIDAYYDMSRYQGVVTLCELVIVIFYYVVYQIYNDGQTIGKKIMRIKVVSRNGDLTMNQMVFRSCLSTPLVINFFSLLLLSFFSKYTYFYSLLVMEFIFGLVLLVSCFMVMFSKNGLALHDKLFDTEVVGIN